MTAYRTRRDVLIAALSALALSSCQSVPGGVPMPANPPPQTPGVTETLPPAKGETIGQGPVRIALLLPLSDTGAGARIGAELRNAAQIAMEDFGMQAIQLVIKDTGGDPARARAAASEATEEGSSAVLGPVFATEVTEVATVLRPANKIDIAFSSDRSVGGFGVYLNSFLPQGVVDRIASHAVDQGLKNFVAVVPNTPAGTVAETQLRETVQARGGNVLQVERYDLNDASVQVAASNIAAKAAEAQAIFIPDGGNSPSAVAAALRSNGVDMPNKRILGTGLWNTASLGDPALTGAWIADTDQDKIGQFKARYRQKFGSDPSINAVLGYDSVALAAGIVRLHGPVGFTRSVLENRSGFTGYGGAFRFGSDGSNQRAYTVYEVQAGGGRKVLSPSPTSFAGR